MTGRTGWLRYAAVGVLLLGAVACTDEPDPAPPTASPSATSASPSPTAPVTPTPSETGPTVPEAARANTPEGAEAFVRFYLDLVNEAWTTPEAGLLPPFSAPDCEFCANTERDAEQFVASNTKYASAPISIGDTTALSTTGRQALFEIEVTQLPVQLVRDSGEVVRTAEGETAVYRIGALWSGSGWSMEGVQRTT